MDIPRWIVRRRGWVALGGLAAAAALLPAAARVEEALDVGARLSGSESAAVEEILAREFSSPFAHFALLVATGLPPADTEAGAAALGEVVAGLEELPGVSRTLYFLDTPDTLFLGRDGGAFVVVGLDPGEGTVDALIPQLRATSAALQAELRPRHAEATLGWTGEAALNFDLRRTSAEEGNDAERRALPLTLGLLLLAFGSVVAAALPVVTGALALSLALGLAATLAEWMDLSILLVNVVTMVGLGLGIDYALLMVSRFREGLSAGHGAPLAAEEAARSAGHTIMVSGAAVAIGFAALLAVPVSELRSIAVGGLLVVATTVALATTVLPAVLAWLGPKVDLLALGRRKGRASRGEVWRRWAALVSRRPRTVLLLAGTPVLLLAFQATRLDTQLPRGDWLPARMESATALRDLQGMGRGGVVQSIRVLLELPAPVGALDPAGWEATRLLGDALAADPRVARVRSLPELTGLAAPHPLLISRLPEDVLRSFTGGEGRYALLEVVPAETVEPVEVNGVVRELRAWDAAGVTGLTGAGVLVGGLPAFNVDYEDAVSGWLPLVIGLVVGATVLGLALAFRSILIPLKAVALNLLSVAGAFGAVVLVFQDGRGAGLLGLEGPTGGVFPAIPVLVFCIVFGLSMDYEVFLVARIAEARRAGLDETEALAEGLARTGRLITSAAAIMIAVFAAFMLGSFLLMKMLGFALAVAVLLDATVMRVAVGPALLRLAGRWNWWPGEPGRAGGDAAAGEHRARTVSVAGAAAPGAGM